MATYDPNFDYQAALNKLNSQYTNKLDPTYISQYNTYATGRNAKIDAQGLNYAKTELLPVPTVTPTATGGLNYGSPVPLPGGVNYGSPVPLPYNPVGGNVSPVPLSNNTGVPTSNYSAPATTGKTTNTTNVDPNLIGFRSTAEAAGLKVDWSPDGTVKINGVPVNLSGLTNFGYTPPAGYEANRYYGNKEQIDAILKPFLSPLPKQPDSQQIIDNNMTFDPPKAQPYEAMPELKASYEEYAKWASEDFNSTWAPIIESRVNDMLNRTFNYDPSQDPQLNLATKNLTRQVLETMNARGILNSSITENQLQQGIADLMPQYRQMAYQQFMDEGQMLMSQVNMLSGLDDTAYGRFMDEGEKLARGIDIVMKMDDTQYGRWKDAYEMTYRQYKDTYDAAIQQIQLKRQGIADAWDRVTQLGYVDNKSSLILGVPAGTLSKDAREAKQAKEDKIAEEQRQWEAEQKRMKMEYDYNTKLAKTRASASGSSASGTKPKIDDGMALSASQYKTAVTDKLKNTTKIVDYRGVEHIVPNMTKAEFMAYFDGMFPDTDAGDKLYDEVYRVIGIDGIRFKDEVATKK